MSLFYRRPPSLSTGSGKEPGAPPSSSNGSAGLDGFQGPSQGSGKRQTQNRSSKGHMYQRMLLPCLLFAMLAYFTIFSPDKRPPSQHSQSTDRTALNVSSLATAPAYDVTLYTAGAAEMYTAAPSSDGEKYVSALVCKGFCNQVMSLFDAAASAYLLNATLVLPDFYTGFDYFSHFTALSEKDISFDPQAHQAVPFGFFFDTSHFIRVLQPFLKITRELPDYLKARDHSSRLTPVRLDPTRPESVLVYQEHLQQNDVLRLRCLLNSVVWSTKVRLECVLHNILQYNSPCRC